MGRKRAQSGKPFAGAARFFSVGLCGLRFAEPPLQRADFSAWGGKGRKAASLLRAQPGIFRGTGSPSRLCAGRIFPHGAKKDAKRQTFCGRSPVFLRGALRITVRRAAFAAADFSARCGKGAQSGKPFAGAARFFSVGLCGLRFAELPLRRRAIFPYRAEKDAKRQAFCGRSPVFLRGALRVTVRRAAFAAADFFRTGRKRTQSGEPFAGAAGFFPWNRFAEPLLRGEFFPHGAEKGRTAERRAGFGFIPKRMKRNSGNYSLASSGSKRLCRLRKSRQSGREKIAVSATCGAITV